MLPISASYEELLMGYNSSVLLKSPPIPHQTFLLWGFYSWHLFFYAFRKDVAENNRPEVRLEWTIFRLFVDNNKECY